MTRNRVMMTLIGFAMLGLGLGGCGKPAGSAKASAGSKAASGVKAAKSQLTAKKPQGTQQTATAPKPIPAAKSGGGTTVAPPQPAATAKFEAWTFSQVDVDGDGNPDSGDVFIDVETQTLYAGWSGASDLDGDGKPDTYTAFAWVNDQVFGVLLDLGGGQLACGGSADGSVACIACNAEGTCEVATDN